MTKEIVKFIKPWNSYYPGDIAGFEGEKALQLVQAGVAQPHDGGDDTGTGGGSDTLTGGAGDDTVTGGGDDTAGAPPAQGKRGK